MSDGISRLQDTYVYIPTYYVKPEGGIVIISCRKRPKQYYRVHRAVT